MNNKKIETNIQLTEEELSQVLSYIKGLKGKLTLNNDKEVDQ
jgi:hypothetical protein